MKEYYCELLRLIITSELPTKKMVPMIETLRQLKKENEYKMSKVMREKFGAEMKLIEYEIFGG